MPGKEVLLVARVLALRDPGRSRYELGMAMTDTHGYSYLLLLPTGYTY